MSDKAEIFHHDTPDGSVSGAGIAGPKSKGAKGHCKKFWWIYVLLLVVSVVIVVPCVILVAVPNMAQARLDNASLDIDSIVISQAEKDSFHMAINSTILADNGVHATIRAFEGTMSLLPDQDGAAPMAFAKFQFPEVASAAAVVVNVSQKVAVGDVDSLVAFNEALLAKDFVHVRVEGDTQIRVAGIARDYPVTFRKDVQLKAFNGFAGLSVSNINVTLATANNFNGTVSIPNPTVFTFELGNTTWNNYLDGGANVGTAYIQNLAMHPESNDFFIWADIAQGPVLTALGKKPVCESPDGDLTFQLSGKTVENEGQSIPWLATALSAHNASVTMPVGAAVAKALGGGSLAPRTEKKDEEGLNLYERATVERAH
ncbi:hypothetical protein PG993_001252 [Apiospora rasikravindrae]|uniref:DUF2993 domain-containing protein n=1 Tax=Apiospora rasikravindrae TaxID=990691 RepID=A0ABR1UAX2_9PEZI